MALLPWLRGVIRGAGPELPPGWRGASWPEASVFGTPLVRPHPDGRSVIRLAQRGSEEAFGIWDVGSGRLVQFLPEVADARWTPDGLWLVTATAEDEVGVSIRAWPSLELHRAAPLPFSTRRGVAGLELVLSGTGRFGAAWIYSGQSEEGWVLFSLPDAAPLATIPYLLGESASPCLFSPDERHLLMVVEPGGAWWAGAEAGAAADTPARGGPVRWATLHVQEVRENGSRSEIPIIVDLPLGWVPGDALDGATWPRGVRFDGPGRLVFDVPWGGQGSIAFPPAGPCYAPPPST
ncbi:MAG: hypothetical protein IPO09_20840 [Anaeromyxobacter sp.]|nr:hypothetical protein [Anaeromyxobacter sp.]MBL0274790.1 hypothetical protein [Anaeromyxobacter sp.]